MVITVIEVVIWITSEKLKLKGVEMKKTKQKKSDKGDPNPLPPSDTASQKTPSQLLQERIKKKVW